MTGGSFVTPPGWWHSHHNDSAEDAWVLPMQDAGLYTQVGREVRAAWLAGYLTGYWLACVCRCALPGYRAGGLPAWLACVYTCA